MTTQQLIWIAFGELGLIAFMVFMYGMARAKYHGLENDNVYLMDVKSNRIRYIEHELDLACDVKAYLKADNEQLSNIIKEMKADLSTEGDLRRDASQQIEAMHNELNQLNRLVQKRGKDGRYIGKA